MAPGHHGNDNPSVPAVGLLRSPDPIVIAHRGASGWIPEQTLEAFDKAIEHGADAIEFDVVPTRDGVLLARHENELSATTNVANLGAFASRQATREIDGAPITGWFAEDFDTAEIRALRARQRYDFRDHALDDQFPVPTLNDVLEWLLRRRHSLRREIGLFIEIKHPTYFAGVGFDVARTLDRTLAQYNLADSGSGVVLMSFETKVLRDLRSRTELPLVQLLDAPQSRPFDWEGSGISRTYGDMVKSGGLAEIAQYADGIGPWKRLIVPAQDSNSDGPAARGLHLAEPTSLISDAHEMGLFVCSWTFRDEPRFLAANYDGKPRREYEQFFRLGIDAVITDFPDTALAAKEGRSP